MIRKIYRDLLLRYRSNRKIFYSASLNCPNFGDVLSLEIVNYYSRTKYRKASINQAGLIAIGSVLDLYLLKYFESKIQMPLKVWGAGFMAEKGKHHRLGDQVYNEFCRPMLFSCVRGYLTLDRIKQMGYDVENTKVGDPGLLASSLFDFRSIKKKYSLGIMAHYVDRRNPIFQEISTNVPSSVIIDIFDSPKKILRTLMQCEALISSAMHGLIAADSLGLPNKWVKVSNGLHGEDYKFYDYYSVYGISASYLTIENILSAPSSIISTIQDEYDVNKTEVEIIKRNLIKSMPFGRKFFRSTLSFYHIV